jgi:hypothetical protein
MLLQPLGHVSVLLGSKCTCYNAELKINLTPFPFACCENLLQELSHQKIVV